MKTSWQIRFINETYLNTYDIIMKRESYQLDFSQIHLSLEKRLNLLS